MRLRQNDKPSPAMSLYLLCNDCGRTIEEKSI
jgi:hypothetical protein